MSVCAIALTLYRAARTSASRLPVPFQQVQAASHLMTHRIIFPMTVPPKEARQLLLRNDGPSPQAFFSTDLDVSQRHLTNKHLRVEVSQRGIEQVWVDGRPVLGAQGIRLHLRQDGTDIWAMDTDAFTQPVLELFSSEREQWVVEEAGPLRARIRLDGWLGHSRVRWTLSLSRDTPCVNISLDLLFSEHLALLQMPVHVAEAPRTWRDGQAMGAVERQRDAGGRPVEWPVQRWSKMILAHGHEIALVTNDAFSVSLSTGNRWQ